MDVELAPTTMRAPLLAHTLAAGLALLGAPPLAGAQSGGAPAGEPTACVSATGPDSGAGTSAGAARDATARAARDSAGHAALRLFAAVEAQEVRFERQPRICVTLRGDARLDSVRVVGRRNLVSPVVRGTTYRDVYVAVEILGHLDAECISARITGTAASGASSGPCASLDVRDGAAARRTGAPPP
jgi:hypothetical protein